MEAIVTECNSGKYDLKAKLMDMKSVSYEEEVGDFSEFQNFDITIIPADRIEVGQFAYSLFRRNIPFCHYLSGSITFSYCTDDITRWLISLMANFCFAESPEAAENLKRVGIPEDRIMISGTSHFDGVTIYDIEANKPKDAPEHYYDLVLLNPETMKEKSEFVNPQEHSKNTEYIVITPNEDAVYRDRVGKEYQRLEFLWLLTHADHFISNSSAGHYELPYLQKYYGSKCKWVNPSVRNNERTFIDPMYCAGASKIIAEWCQGVDLEWLKQPKKLFGTTPSLSGF